jgi:16S rRNA processing protein RimM
MRINVAEKKSAQTKAKPVAKAPAKKAPPTPAARATTGKKTPAPPPKPAKAAKPEPAKAAKPEPAKTAKPEKRVEAKPAPKAKEDAKAKVIAKPPVKAPAKPAKPEKKADLKEAAAKPAAKADAKPKAAPIPKVAPKAAKPAKPAPTKPEPAVAKEAKKPAKTAAPKAEAAPKPEKPAKPPKAEKPPKLAPVAAALAKPIPAKPLAVAAGRAQPVSRSPLPAPRTAAPKPLVAPKPVAAEPELVGELQPVPAFKGKAPGSKGMVLVGAIAGAFGVKGEVRLRAFTEKKEGVISYGPLYSEDGRVLLRPKSWRALKDGVAVVAPEIKSREQAEAMKGTRLFVPRANLPSPHEDEFYIVDLLGCRAEALDGQVLGEICAVWNFGAGDIIEYRPPNGGPNVRVTFTKETAPLVDLSGKRVVLDPPAPEPLEK